MKILYGIILPLIASAQSTPSFYGITAHVWNNPIRYAETRPPQLELLTQAADIYKQSANADTICIRDETAETLGISPTKTYTLATRQGESTEVWGYAMYTLPIKNGNAEINFSHKRWSQSFGFRYTFIGPKLVNLFHKFRSR